MPDVGLLSVSNRQRENGTYVDKKSSSIIRLDNNTVLYLKEVNR